MRYPETPVPGQPLLLLGATLMHEHVVVLSPEIMQNYPGLSGDEQRRIHDAVTRLDELAATGVRSLVDLTVIALGRYLPRIQLVAERTSLNIIVGTGLYTCNDVPFYFYFRGQAPPAGAQSS